MAPRFVRNRRLRSSQTLRTMLQEVRLSPEDFVWPVFVVTGKGVRKSLPSLPGVYLFSPDELVKEVENAYASGIKSILLFGRAEHKDSEGSEAWNPKGAVQEAIRRLKQAIPEMFIFTDVCLCAYTTSGHCGVLRNGHIDNDATLEYLARIALSHCEAGSDGIAPSDMMDGHVLFLREVLDQAGFQEIPIMAYTAKFASALYTPFREAVNSAPAFGDRSPYQVAPSNLREAIREAMADVAEGADIIMVKPALPYLDVIRAFRERFPLPLAAFQVSGEYAMVKYAALSGAIEEKKTALELLLSIKRAGADLIISYFALQAVRWIQEG
ncbi:porphobilinogen synthase [Candidatus Caldatribacterium sp.]|uniref:porphobilinogen synthase n=1 Tax=Candidatus Caldatribacterium sp. TaxID=2282143 RepID=UPI002990F0E4|nr:porphobilinogen synthase [Candidatus Caldatribacterium sp.]MDW8080593.1 porphobilinogen synthase [Candidatus Calescibacterium sp.]